MAISALVLVPVAVASKNARAAAISLAALTAGSLPWLIPALLHTVYADPGGVAAFASRADTPFGTVGSLVMLGGMWNAATVPKAYGGPWSAIWLAVVLAALAGYALIGCRRPRRWPGLTIAALVSLAIACIGITEPGRALLRGAISDWPAFAILRDAQQFIAPLALAGAIGFGLAVTWCVRPRPFGQNLITNGAPSRPPPRPRPDPPTPSAWPWACSPSSPRSCSCPGWPGARPGGCARPGTRPVSWPRPA